MKIYTNSFDMNQRGDRIFYVPQYSQYKFGVKVIENGSIIPSARVKLVLDGVELTKDENPYNDYIIYTRNSTVTKSNVIDVKIDGKPTFILTEKVTDSTVYDIDESGSAYVLPIASDTVLGGVKVGDNLAIAADGTLSAKGGSEYVLPAASKTTLGGIIVGDNINVDADGKISVAAPTEPYTLPIASDTVLGGIKVGANLAIAADGTLSAVGGQPIGDYATKVLSTDVSYVNSNLMSQWKKTVSQADVSKMEEAGCWDLLSTMIDVLGGKLDVFIPPSPAFKDNNGNEYNTLAEAVAAGSNQITQLRDYELTDEDCGVSVPMQFDGQNFKLIGAEKITSVKEAIFLQSNTGYIRNINFELNSTNINSVIKYTGTDVYETPSLTCENIVAQNYVISPTGYFFRGTSTTASMAIYDCNVKCGVANTYAIVRVDDSGNAETVINNSTFDSSQNTNSYANKVYNSTVACKGKLTISNSTIKSSGTQLDAVCAGYKATTIDSCTIYGGGAAAIYCRNQGMITINGNCTFNGLLECTTSKVNCYTITDGTFDNFNVKWNGNESVTASQAINGTVAAVQFVKMQGGKYNINPTSLGNTKIIDDGYTVVQEGNYWKVTAA